MLKVIIFIFHNLEKMPVCHTGPIPLQTSTVGGAITEFHIKLFLKASFSILNSSSKLCPLYSLLGSHFFVRANVRLMSTYSGLLPSIGLFRRFKSPRSIHSATVCTLTVPVPSIVKGGGQLI